MLTAPTRAPHPLLALVLALQGCIDIDPNGLIPDVGPGPLPAADAGTVVLDASSAAEPTAPDGSTDANAADAHTSDADASGDAGDAGWDAGSSTGCLPFDLPPIDLLRASPRKVFAHYFAPFPISIDNLEPTTDYYSQQYLAPEGEAGKWQSCGGYLRDRPIARAVSASPSWFDDDYALEIRRARELGLDGFTFDILATSGPMWERLDKMLSAAERVDASFRIVLMPDMYATFLGSDSAATSSFVDAMTSVVAAHANSVFRLDDQRVVIAPYGAEQRTNAWWKGALEALAARGVQAAFVPLFSNVPLVPAMRSMAQLVPLAGVASWGTRTASAAPALQQAAQTVHDAGLLWMAPVAPQDARPKELVYWEAQNSLSFRRAWEAAIQGAADWVQLITWNDYSESTQVSPSERTGFAFADLSAYYTTWFKTGSAPTVTRDRLYYVHRAHAMTSAPDPRLQTGGAFRVADGAPSSDEIELVAFLAQPGTLEIENAGRTTRVETASGLSTLRVPLADGTPKFRLIRAGVSVLAVESATPITSVISYQDPLYHAGGSPRCGP